MARASLAAVAASLLAVVAAGCSDDCEGIACGPCGPAINIEFGPLDVSGDFDVVQTEGPTVALECLREDGGGGGGICTSSGRVAPGRYVFDVRAPGRRLRLVEFDLESDGGGCCSCGVMGERQEITLEPIDGDAGASDAGASDAGASDAAAMIDSGTDAPAFDAAAVECNPDRVTVSPSAEWRVGAFCDELTACAADAAAAARITGAAPSWSCDPTSEGPCIGMLECHPIDCPVHEIDAAEYADVCAITLLEPEVPVRCMTFL